MCSVCYRFPLAEHNIPFHQKALSLMMRGKLALPKNYKYKDDLITAGEAKPEVLNAVWATVDVTSQYLGLTKSQPFRDEMAMAKNELARKAIIESLSKLLIR